jgi:hypothetical protein
VLVAALDRLAAVAAGDAGMEAAAIAWGDGDAGIALSLPRMDGAAEDTIDATTCGTARFALSVSKLRTLVLEITRAGGRTVTLQPGRTGEPVAILDPEHQSYLSLLMAMRAGGTS